MNNQELVHEMQRPSTSYLLRKTLIGLVIGALASVLIFVSLYFVGSVFFKTQQADPNPITGLLLWLIAIGISFIGNFMIAGLYNLLMPQTYYESLSSIGRIFASNLIISLVLAPLYFLFLDDFTAMLGILAFHIGFASFLSFNLIEYSSDPNYGPVHLIGTSLGILISVFVLLIAVKIGTAPTVGGQASTKVILISLPPAVVFFLIPLIDSLRTFIYYKLFYENGNNFLYIPSLEEVMVDEEEVEQVNVDTN